MKRFVILTCMFAALAACSSTDNIKIVSPSTPENEARQEIRNAPVTKLETVPQPPVRDEAKGRRDAVSEGPKTETVKVSEPTGASSPSINSPHTLDALINLLDKKGVLHKEELLEEIKKLEMKRTE